MNVELKSERGGEEAQRKRRKTMHKDPEIGLEETDNKPVNQGQRKGKREAYRNRER